MSHCNATQSATQYDKQQSARDTEGDNIFIDAKTSGDFDTAVEIELRNRFTMDYIRENILDALADAGGNIFRIPLQGLPDAVINKDDLYVGLLLRPVWNVLKNTLREEIKADFENAPWRIEVTINA